MKSLFHARQMDTSMTGFSSPPLAVEEDVSLAASASHFKSEEIQSSCVSETGSFSSESAASVRGS